MVLRRRAITQICDGYSCVPWSYLLPCLDYLLVGPGYYTLTAEVGRGWKDDAYGPSDRFRTPGQSAGGTCGIMDGGDT